MQTRCAKTEAPTPGAFRKAIGHFPTGVTVVTTRSEGEDFGTTVSAICSLSDEPPMLLVCMNRSSATGAEREGREGLADNLRGEDRRPVAGRFPRRGSDFEAVQTES